MAAAEPREKTAAPETRGQVIATGVSLEEYMEHYAADFCEWVEGAVIKLSPAELKHNRVIYYLYYLIAAYFELHPIGRIVGQPFVMRLPTFPNRRREPDLLVVLESNPHELKDTYLDGPADICIEVVSEASAERDHGEKFIEYEKGGVNEYWIIDPLRREGRFYRLAEDGHYRRQNEDAEGGYHTPTLPGLTLHVPTLWEENLPGPAATVEAVRSMLQDL
jgi:Uma2 family endonuclease